MGINLVMAVVAVFVLNGEIKTVRMESANITQCLTELVTVENMLNLMGVDDPEVRCEIKIEREEGI